MPMPARLAANGSAKPTGTPSRMISPESGFRMPARMFIRVLLPAPFSPQITWTSPRSTMRSTRSSATLSSNFLTTPRNCSKGAADPSLMASAPSRKIKGGARGAPPGASFRLESAVDLDRAAQHLGLGLVHFGLYRGRRQRVVIDQPDAVILQSVDFKASKRGLTGFD